MTTEDTEQLLVDGLQELYYAEQQLVDALSTMADQSTDQEATTAFSEHRDETENHVSRLEEVFDEIGADAEPKEEPVVDALIEEHEQFASENDGDILDRYNIAAAQKTEHYEIAAYGNVTSLAGKLDYENAADLLEETLREEEQALDDVSSIGEQFDQQQVASD